MKTIWKFPIEITTHQKIQMPVCADILHADLDPEGTPCVWALVQFDSPKAVKSWRDIFIYGTGNPVSKCEKYIGTFKQGPLVRHVFS
jgi:hypothetical protein